MAKKKKRIPKKVAGFKVPKFLRNSELLKALMKSPAGRKIAAQALTAAAGAAAAVLMAEREAVAEPGGEVAHEGKKGLNKGAKTLGIAGEAAKSAAGAMVGVVADAARSILPEDSEQASAKKKKPREGDDLPPDAVTH